MDICGGRSSVVGWSRVGYGCLLQAAETEEKNGFDCAGRGAGVHRRASAFGLMLKRDYLSGQSYHYYLNYTLYDRYNLYLKGSMGNLLDNSTQKKPFNDEAILHYTDRR